MNRLELPLFPLMLALSFFGHLGLFLAWLVCWAIQFTAPELIPSQSGVASVRLMPEDARHPKPAEKSDDLLADLPILNDPVNLPAMADPKLVKPKQRPMERPREFDPVPNLTSVAKIPSPTELPDLNAELVPRLTTRLETAKTTAPQQEAMERPHHAADPMPELTSDPKVFAPAAVPDLRADLLAVPMPPKEMVKPPDPLKPLSMNRPKTEKVELPKLETETKVADRATKPSPPSVEMEGAINPEIPSILVNPPPSYPAQARAAGEQGIVELLVTVGTEGGVAAISVYSSSGVKSLDDAALAAVRRWVFVPARRNGRAFARAVRVPVQFSIAQ